MTEISEVNNTRPHMYEPGASWVGCAFVIGRAMLCIAEYPTHSSYRDVPVLCHRDPADPQHIEVKP